MQGKPVTVIDIAHAAGMSKSAVSLVLRDAWLVDAGTRAKVGETIRAPGYVHNRGAAELRGAGSDVIGIVVDDLTDGFFAEIAVGMDMVTRSAGFVRFLADTGESLDRQRTPPRRRACRGPGRQARALLEAAGAARRRPRRDLGAGRAALGRSGA